jgi:TonB family protein
MNVSPQALEASAQKAAQKTEEDNVALPSRRPSMFPEEAINLPSSKKTVNPDALPNFSPSNKISGDERKSSPSSSTFSSKGDVKVGASGRTGGGGGTNPYGTGSGNGTGNGIGDGSGDGVSYGIEWGGHGTRRLESGALPVFPSGVNREAQIKLKLVVMPSGAVKSAQPLQKGDTRLENAALKAVRLWKFDALQSAQAAVDQACTVTFNFKLK